MKQKFTLAIYTVNRKLETLYYNEIPFESLQAVKDFLHNEYVREINLNTWMDPWTLRSNRQEDDIRHIYVAMDFIAPDHLTKFVIPDYERRELIAAGWEV